MITGPPSLTSTLMSDGLEGEAFGDEEGFLHDRKAGVMPIRKRENNAKCRVPRPASFMVVSRSALDRSKNNISIYNRLPSRMASRSRRETLSYSSGIFLCCRLCPAMVVFIEFPPENVPAPRAWERAWLPLRWRPKLPPDSRLHS